MKLAPIIDELTEEYEGKLKFSKLNVLGNPENKQIAFRYGVMRTPTLVLFCGGRPVETIVGSKPKESLRKSLDEILRSHRECIRQRTEHKY